MGSGSRRPQGGADLGADQRRARRLPAWFGVPDRGRAGADRRGPARKGDAAEVTLTGERWQPGVVAWVDVDLDVAVVDARRDGQAPRELCAEGRIRWGKLAGSDPLKWDAVGYPAASRADDQGGRHAEQVYGRTAPISERQAGTLALTVESRPPAGGGSSWSGLSGAAVFCGDYLVGVVTTDPGSWERSLEARRAEAFAADDDLAGLLRAARACLIICVRGCR